jgi:hypothetical protein
MGGEANSPDAGQGAGARTSGGAPAGGAGSAEGGTPTQPNGNAGDGGSPAPVGTGGGAGAAGAPSDVAEMLELCARISMKTIHAQDVSREYAKAAYGHCDTHWILRTAVDAGPGLAQYRNDLAAWSYAFWGCGADPVTTFGLVYGTPPLSEGDAHQLIDMYLETAKADLGMSPGEVEDMRAALERLSQLVVTDASAAPSQPGSNPRCAAAGGSGGEAGMSNGGAGGALVEDSGSAGHGGAP